MNGNIIIGRISAALLLASTALSPAFAQDAAPQEDETGGGIQEIVVTAQKRAENVQDVPIAVSAFGEEALQERAVGSVAQLSSLAPNVTLDGSVPFSGSTAVLAASIRGIGSNDFAFNIDPGVGVYLDGVYLARSVGANQDLLDIARIEVLKGPQGTLFGRNTIGGAVSVVTSDPGKEFGGKADLTYGRFDLLQARGSINIPLTDSLFSSVTFAIKSRDGYGKRIPFPDARASNSPSYTVYPATGYDSPSREGDEESRTVRLKLKYDDGGPFRITVSGDYQRGSASAPYSLLQTVTSAISGPVNFGDFVNICATSNAATLTAISGAVGLNFNNLCGSYGTQLPSVRRGVVTPVRRLTGLSGVNADGNPANDRLLWGNQFITNDPDLSYANGNNFSKLTNWGLAAIMDYDISDDVALKSITSYREGHWLSGIDADGSPLNIFHLSFDQDQWQYSQELQLTGSMMDKKLNYVLGAYYFREKGTLLDLVTFGEGMNQIDGPNWLDTENYAVFGQIDFRPIDLIGITLGGRYTHEKKLFEGGQQELNGLFYKLAGCSDVNGTITPFAPIAGPGSPTCRVALGYPTNANPLRVYPEGINKQTFNNFSPKVGVQVHPSDDIMLYGSWSKGYKTGGWTTRYTTPQTTVANYDPEEATTFEIGVKSTLIDRRLQVNAAAFSTKYSDIQLNYQVGTSPTIDNVGDARIKGFEVEVVAVPIDALTINASIGHLDATYTRLDPAVAVTSGTIPGFQAGALVGGPLPKTPSWKFNISPRLELPIGNGGKVVLLGDWTHTTKMWNNVERTIALLRPSTDLFNASISYTDPSDRYSLTLGGTNLSDERYIQSGNSIAASGVVSGVYSRPREYYLRLGVNF
jgi:iron complex outermembrane recepter protein